MKKRIFKQLLSVILCAALLFSCLPFTAFAESADTDLQMVEGDVIADFVPEGTECASSDPSIAWVDESGSLNAMKVGTTVISDGTTDYTVTVSDYDDGSEVVGNLKILARYNDSMQFYDGHVYLLFTSYQDGVTVTVPDLYAAYEIRDQYYEDIAEDIANGSNHTGNNAYEYFNECYDVDILTLNRGEIVTIGMYRGFDLSVPQAALGSIQNSSLWKGLTSAVKASITTIILDYLNRGKLSSDEALARLKTVIEQEDLDYTKLLDGVVDGGVCFNRELYNQKLEWDQYENVTYELDITRNQLDMMMLYLGCNNGKFSIIKNSCATVALRGWNAAVGMRDGQPTSYFLTSGAEGIYSFVAAPYWDMSFPAVLRTYLENIYVIGIVSEYGADGMPRGLCKADKLYYITTAGGPYTPDYSYDYIRELATLCFGIKETELIKAEMLDVEGFDADEIVRSAINRITLF